MTEWGRASCIERGFCLSAALVALAAGCALPHYHPDLHKGELVAWDQNLDGTFVFNNFIPADSADARVVIASIEPVGPDLYLVFRVLFKKGVPPRSIQAEDVSDSDPELFVDDQNPGFAIDPAKPSLNTRLWEWRMGPLAAIAWRPDWLREPSDTLRTYRFTIVTAGGHKVVLRQATDYPFAVKQFILRKLSENPHE